MDDWAMSSDEEDEELEDGGKWYYNGLYVGIS